MTERGTIHYTHGPDTEPWDVDPETSCNLDVTSRGQHTNEEIAEIWRVTPQAVDLVYQSAIGKIRTHLRVIVEDGAAQ